MLIVLQVSTDNRFPKVKEIGSEKLVCPVCSFWSIQIYLFYFFSNVTKYNKKVIIINR